MPIDQTTTGHGRQVLLVEAQMMPMLMAEDLLLAEGYRVATAGSFKGAAHAMSTCVVEAAVLDLDLPDHSSELLADQFTGLGIPILFASTRGEGRLPERFRDRSILQKPYLPDELLAKVSSLLEQGHPASISAQSRRGGP